jgi:hypothetical protein
MPKLNYLFDAVPKGILPMVKCEKLKWVDIGVLIALLQWRRDTENSCWTTIGILQDQTGLSERWVQCSLRRLERAGVVHRKKCPKPDPDDPRNRTGWRFHFTFEALEECSPVHPSGRSGVRSEGAAEFTQSEIGVNGDGMKRDGKFRQRTHAKRGVPPFDESLATTFATDLSRPSKENPGGVLDNEPFHNGGPWIDTVNVTPEY